LPLLRERALQDPTEFVRYTAVYALSRYYPGDAGTLPLLREIAENDSADSLRETAKLLVAELESKQKELAS